MKKKEIQKKYKNYIKIYKRYNEYYFNKSKPLVKDDKYDQLKREIINLEKEYEFLASKNSPTKTVGYKPSKNFKKALHRVPMLSLANAFSEEDLINFEKKLLNFLSKEPGFKLSYSAEPNICFSDL